MTLRDRAAPLFLLVASVLAKHGGDDGGDDGGTPTFSATGPLSSSTSAPSSSATGQNGGASSSAKSSSTDNANGTPSTTTSSPASSITAPSVNGTFTFIDPGNMTTCQPGTFQWSDTDSHVVALTLEVRSEFDVDASSNSTSISTISRVLTNSTLSTVGKFTWSDVDVPEGWYCAVVFDTADTIGLHVQSPLFFIQSGQSTSCVVSNSTTTSPDASNNTSTSASADTSQSGGSTGGLSNAALAGTIVAAVIGVLLLTIAFSVPHWWKRTLPFRSRNRRPGGPYDLF
ncbi:hypothetical protein CERSUDRAFT_97675 [Gelatoporia subvermispora B]|uniref:Uncharacterized protein n=1 Tax=Ceriporiopsis subvermispora (strain B) TaxID=914234 RepID=M2QQI8_CERS8|nr:hypothetical protein CERSUDRAFT_97675 [Gelatoporia subvermispora B]